MSCSSGRPERVLSPLYVASVGSASQFPNINPARLLGVSLLTQRSSWCRASCGGRRVRAYVLTRRACLWRAEGRLGGSACGARARVCVGGDVEHGRFVRSFARSFVCGSGRTRTDGDEQRAVSASVGGRKQKADGPRRTERDRTDPSVRPCVRGLTCVLTD